VLGELVVGFDTFAGDADLGAAVANPAAEVNPVVGLVGVQFAGFAAAGSASGLKPLGWPSPAV
jgi:hypothetical protein